MRLLRGDFLDIDEQKLQAAEISRQPESMISVKNLEYYYDVGDGESIHAIKNVSFEIKRGEFVAVLGHNGSGKSTLAKLLNAQMMPTKGDISILGMNTKDEEYLWDIRSHCGIVFQNPDNQLVASIVEEDVAFGPENLGIPNPELRNRVDRALMSVGMYDYRRRAPQNLSGGQKQRIAIAGVLAMMPKCIIMDEPTAMLDPMGRLEIMKAVEYLNTEENITFLMITHFMEEAVKADRVIVMSDGKIAMQGTPREIFSQVDKMRELELDVPQVTELAYRLNKAGYEIPGDCLSIEELLEVIHGNGI